MRWHSWSRGKGESAEQLGLQPDDELLAWWEFWDQILSGLAWSG